jgi:hypothetical protein
MFAKIGYNPTRNEIFMKICSERLINAYEQDKAFLPVNMACRNFWNFYHFNYYNKELFEILCKVVHQDSK